MSLLFNNKSKLVFLLISIFLLIIQINFPSIFTILEYPINIDFLLVYLTFLALYKNSFKIILLAFIYGSIQDIILNVEDLGVLSFIKSLSIYLILIQSSRYRPREDVSRAPPTPHPFAKKTRAYCPCF